MKVTASSIAGVLLIEPTLHTDARGTFFESFNKQNFRQSTGLEVSFVQDNHSHSRRSVLRGLHYQIVQPQGKLVRVSSGSVFDVAVDLRRHSPTFGQWSGDELSGLNRLQKWIPPGFAHGFLVTSDFADVLYKTTQCYAAEHERCLQWNDADLAIQWPLTEPPLLSSKDEAGLPFSQAQTFGHVL